MHLPTSYTNLPQYKLQQCRQIDMDDSKPKLRLARTTCPTCGAEVLPADLIPAGEQEICPNCRDAYAQSLKEGVRHPASVAGGGTGGATPNRELRAKAREALSGNWLKAVAVVFLYFAISQLLALIPIVGPIAQWLISGALTVGFFGCFLNLARSGNIVIGDLFEGFSMFWKGFFVYFITTLIISLVAIAAAIPGGLITGLVYFMDVPVPEEHPLFFIGLFIVTISVIAAGTYMSLRYALVYFVVNDDPEINVFEVLKTSQRRMEGHKKKLFGLFLSYVPWFLLGLMALIIGLLWSYTYAIAGFAAFYEDLGEAA